MMVTPTFVNVDGTEYNIDDLKVNGAPDTMANICVMNASGDWVGQYYWYNEAVYEGVTYPAGWFDIDGVEPAGVTLRPGDAVYFYTNQDGATIQSAGQVPEGVTLATPAGYTMVGNASPIDLPIDNLKVTGAADTLANICVMNAAGDWVGQYYWYNEATYEGVTYPAGWFDIDGVESAGITLKPGEAVYFYTNQNGVSVSIPSAL